MIGDKRPGETGGVRFSDDIAQTFNEIIPVLIIFEYPLTLDSTDDDMMQRSGSIDARFAWHTTLISHSVHI